MRGTCIAPQPAPAQAWLTLSQQELVASRRPERSQWNRTLTRPYLSQWISSPEGPVTIAVCGPCTKGRAVRRGGR